jgi:hypothetical protein
MGGEHIAGDRGLLHRLSDRVIWVVYASRVPLPYSVDQGIKPPSAVLPLGMIGVGSKAGRFFLGGRRRQTRQAVGGVNGLKALSRTKIARWTPPHPA